MARKHVFLCVVATLLFITAVLPPRVDAARARPTEDVTPKLQVFLIDEFTYRVSFRLSDDVEVLLLRGAFRLMYYYQHHHPTVSKHHLSAVIGFYYAKTVLGRSLIESAEADSVAFYPMWKGFAGEMHDWRGEGPALEFNDTLVDGQMRSTYPMIINKPISRYLPSFGGIFVIDGLRIHLRDGSSIDVSDDSMTIELEKRSGKIHPEGSFYPVNTNLSYESSVQMMTLTVPAGSASMLLVTDMIMVISLAGVSISAVTVFILHRFNRIHISLERIRGVLESQQQHSDG